MALQPMGNKFFFPLLLIALSLAGCVKDPDNKCTKLTHKTPDYTCAASRTPNQGQGSLIKTLSSSGIYLDNLPFIGRGGGGVQLLVSGVVGSESANQFRKSRVHGAPGPVMGVGGLPLLLAGYWLYRRRRVK